jgi:Ring finger domain
MAGNNEEIDANRWERQFLLDEMNFNLERQEDGGFDEDYDDIGLFNDDEGMIQANEYATQIHYGEHPVLPGQDPRGPPYMMLQLFNGAGPQQQQQFLVQERPAVFEFVARLIQHALHQEDYEEHAPKEYEFVLQQMENVREDWVCSICLDTDEENPGIKVQHPAECHTFHSVCLQRWLGQTPTCPDCRAARTPMFARPKPQ